jgi:hypothetical protein
MSLISRGGVSLALKDMAKMTTTVVADNFCALHSKGIVHMSLHSARDGVKVCWPATAGFELVVGRIERSIAASASIHALGWVMGIVFSCARAFGALLTEHTELLCINSN